MSRRRRFGKFYRSLLARWDNVRAYFQGRIIEIEEDASAPRVRHFQMATYNVRTNRTAAKYFVLACGGLENRGYFWRQAQWASGIGNQHDLVVATTCSIRESRTD